MFCRIFLSCYTFSCSKISHCYTFSKYSLFFLLSFVISPTYSDSKQTCWCKFTIILWLRMLLFHFQILFYHFLLITIKWKLLFILFNCTGNLLIRFLTFVLFKHSLFFGSVISNLWKISLLSLFNYSFFCMIVIFLFCSFTFIPILPLKTIIFVNLLTLFLLVIP